jgi:GAF domain-containing protein
MGQQDMNSVSNIVEKGRTESVKTISLLGALGLWVAVAIFAGLQTGDAHYSILTTIGIIVAILLSVANFLANRNKVSLASWLSVFAAEIIFIAISFMVANLGIILAIILLIIISGLAFQSLPTRAAVIATITGIVASVAVLLVDVLSLNPLRIVPPDWLAKITIIAGGIIILILGIQLLRYYQFNSIRAQITVAFVIISVIPLWTVAAPQVIELANNPTGATITIFIATIVMLIALVATAITSNLLAAPINYLTAMSERIRRGELDIIVKLERGDEIGQLSKMIDATATELRHNLETLEDKVKERTADLETTAENAKQRADQLQSIVEITHTITTSIQNFDELLPEITQQTSAALGFYHVGIFLTDQTGQYAILQASNSAGGQKMLKKGYRLKVGQADIVGFVTGSGQPRIALDVGDDATFNNPDLPDTLSEMALPLRVGENIIGALDLQSNEASAFSVEDIGMFSLLANQIAIVIQNARLFEETRAALVEAQVFYRQSATASWREVLRQGTRGYRYLNGSVEAVKTAGETPKKIAAGSGNNPELLTIPINIRGKNLGVLNIRQTGRSQSWSGSEIHIYQSIVDRISFALENARLYQDAQRRASKERVISEIATKVSSSVNMDNILQTAVEELGRVLPGSEVVIQFEQEDETGA